MIEGLSQLQNRTDEALKAIKSHFPQDLFQWQLSNARHLLDGVGELKMIAAAMETQQLAVNAVGLLLPITRYWQDQAEQFGKLSGKIAELYVDACPPNLRNLSFEEIVTVVRAARYQRLGVVHSLPPALVMTLLHDSEIDYDEFGNLLQNMSSEILDCINQELAKISIHHRFADRASLLSEATECHLSGHYAAAQTLAITILDSHLQDVEPISGRNRRTTTDQMRERAGNRNVQDLKILNGWVLFYECIAVLPLQEIFDSPNRDSQLNRHETVHYASTRQLNSTNALRALIAATSIIAHDSVWV
jgi:hypothetical protein